MLFVRQSGTSSYWNTCKKVNTNITMLLILRIQMVSLETPDEASCFSFTIALRNKISWFVSLFTVVFDLANELDEEEISWFKNSE